MDFKSLLRKGLSTYKDQQHKSHKHGHGHHHDHEHEEAHGEDEGATKKNKKVGVTTAAANSPADAR